MNYTFFNKLTKKEEIHSMKMAELDDFKKNNPHLEQLIKFAPAIGDPWHHGGFKTDSGFRQMMDRIRTNNPGSTIEKNNIGEI